MKYSSLLRIGFLFGLIACTKAFQVGDCIQEVHDGEEEEAIYKITQTMSSNLYGFKYIHSEQGNETVELDSTVEYKKVECPDAKRPAKIE